MPEFRKLKELDLWLKPQPTKNASERDEAVDPTKYQPTESKRDTGDAVESEDRVKYRELYLKALKKTYGKVPFETETVEVGSLLEFTEAVLKATKEVKK
jgi:hypothetical protein